ncbi:hypothetical protein [Brevundimonas sp.]|uniref:hypothetical protein n=1 Tax=Brevundimonas sp. TaxID=1871086 RepID=UPI002FCCA05A
MFHKKLFALAGGAMALVLITAQPAMAQYGPPEGRTASEEAGGAVSGERILPGRIGGDRNDRQRQRERANRNQERAPAAPTPEENKAAAQAVLTAAGVGCQVTEATLLGVTLEQHSTFEAICAEGPGYLAVSSTPPQTFNCLELAGQAETSRLRDPAADVGQQCTLPVNLNPVPVLSAYARAASIDCTVDQGAAIGKSTAGNIIYEIGCADRDGYWLENAEGAWKATPCWDLALEQETCRYSTAAETLGAWKTVLAGTDAAACDVQEARRVGRDAQGLTVYEVKCGAGGGYFARVGTTFTAQRVHTCIEAATIAGGCTLTAAAPATSEQ